MNGTDLYRQMTRAWQQARDAVKLTQAAHVRVREVLGNALMAGAPGVTGLLREMDAAAARFEAAVDAPEVTIATTGTTSGGKSTLINFLIGAPIMPIKRLFQYSSFCPHMLGFKWNWKRLWGRTADWMVHKGCDVD